MNESTSIIITDYQQLYNEARIRFLSSNDWGRKRNSFLRELHQKVVVGDNEELKRYLRNKREDELNEFNKLWISKIWEKCFDAEKSEFNVISFFRKLAMVNDGQIDVEDLRAFFIYKCTTENIDNLLRQVLEYEARSCSARINAQNIVVVNGEVVIKKEDISDDEECAPTEHLDNIIFQSNLFDSDARLTILRNTIVSYINLGEDNGKLAPAANSQIEPTEQNEWYYILIAISESGIVPHVLLKDISFVEQMIRWFPWLFHFETVDEMIIFKRKFVKSISRERSLWKYGQKKTITAITDMWARQRSLGLDYNKLSRLYSVSSNLKKALEEVKTEIQKENNSKSKDSSLKKSAIKAFIPIDSVRESALADSNEIVVTEIGGRSISLFLLHRHIEEIFGGQFECKYDWVAVWQWMKNKNFLVKWHRSYDAFAQQWMKNPWLVNGTEPCKTNDLRYYSVVDGVPLQEWEAITGRKKTCKTGFCRLKKLYSMLDKDFEIGQILK